MWNSGDLVTVYMHLVSGTSLYASAYYIIKHIEAETKWPAIFGDDIFKYIFLFENLWIWIKISLKFVPKDPIDNILWLVQIMVWRRTGAIPLPDSIVAQFTDAYLRHLASMS